MVALAKLSVALLGLCVPLVLTARNLQTAPYPAPANETPEYWLNSGRRALEQALALHFPRPITPISKHRTVPAP